ncbi:lipoyl protein ligase domain-containing protein [Paenalcaligenes faecalis]|uniref:lipoyl protein ligase domain-containing protein n=1 Tax=Paenalcaligenes faecalis TaxID=2980099 RepID=UPI0022B9BAA5|nr:lipoate--protein ligase family protein [Paenalcaligenes faecalis]
MTKTLHYVYNYLAAPQHNECDEVLFDLAAHAPQAMIWQGSTGLVVPRSYAQDASFIQCQTELRQQGWPISVRQSGGGVVPQGPGIWNLSLAWRQYGRPLDLAEQAYIQLCTPIQQALADCGLSSSTQAVQGSFCDGRFNLAVLHQGVNKKIVGTAQVWKRIKAPDTLTYPKRKPGDPKDWHVVLAHALILVNVDLALVTHQANQVEKALGRNTRYQAQRICDLSRLGITPDLFLSSLQRRLQQQPVPHAQY